MNTELLTNPIPYCNRLSIEFDVPLDIVKPIFGLMALHYPLTRRSLEANRPAIAIGLTVATWELTTQMFKLAALPDTRVKSFMNAALELVEKFYITAHEEFREKFKV